MAAEMRKRLPELKVIHVTGWADPMTDATDAPVIQKPFKRARLLEAVRELLDETTPGPEGS